MPTDLDRAVLDMALTCLPKGWDVDADAPKTFDELCAHWEWCGRVRVYSGGSDRTIFSAPRFNHAFRAWHDFCHLKLARDFSMEGELAALREQQRMLLEAYGDSLRTQHWCALIEADVLGQQEYEDIHGCFPDDQEAFVRAYMVDRQEALLQTW